MYTQTDITPGLERRVQETHALLVEALKPRNEIRIDKSIRFETVVRSYQGIVDELPVTKYDKGALTTGFGEVYFFEGDCANAKTLLEIAFGFAVAQGAILIYDDSIKKDSEILPERTLNIIPLKHIMNPLGNHAMNIPPRIEVNQLYHYGKRLGYDGKVSDVQAMFERIQSIDIRTTETKYTHLTEKK